MSSACLWAVLQAGIGACHATVQTHVAQDVHEVNAILQLLEQACVFCQGQRLLMQIADCVITNQGAQDHRPC